MSLLPPSLRRAAVLISALDDASADAILDQMSPNDAAKVRRALVELDDIRPEEQQQVLADFLRNQRPSETGADEPGVALELNPEIEASIDRADMRAASAAKALSETESLDFLQDVPPQAIARLLEQEHPQTAAVVVTHLPAQHAAAVLQELPASMATEALERIAAIDAISPDVLADLARGLRRQLAPHLRTAAASAAPLAHLTAVLEAMDFRQRQRLLLQLGQRNNSLLTRLGLFPAAVSQVVHSEEATPKYRLDSASDRQNINGQATQTPSLRQSANSSDAGDVWLTFDELSHFSDAALKAIFAAADPELVLLALTGAESRLVGRILRRLPLREAALLRERLEHPAGIRLREIEQARAALAALASRLAHEGSIELPATLSFAAAV